MAFDIGRLQAKAKQKGHRHIAQDGKNNHNHLMKLPNIEEPIRLDFSKPATSHCNDTKLEENHQRKSLMDVDEEDQVKSSSTAATKVVSNWFSSIFKGLTTLEKVVNKQKLTMAIKSLKEKLLAKNVIEAVAESLCESVALSLEGKTISSFTTMSSIVHKAMEDRIVNILSSQQQVDVVREIEAAKELQRPYMIVFVGVNGVGKTTNLAKVAYWLGHMGLSIMIAACDTFRSGAIEQLAVHVKRLTERDGLDVCMPERIQSKLGAACSQGMASEYGRSILVVAKEAVKEATKANKDVVLVDTAGRMQNNHELINELGNLVNSCNPDLVVFVTEALTGSDIVDQLQIFDSKVVGRSRNTTTKLGILLTKFDTVDDKVGAVVSMACQSWAPLLFLGCGQDYYHLKRPSAKSLVKTLLN